MADLLCGQDSITCSLVSRPLGEILLSEDGVIGFLFHARRGGARRIGSKESGYEPAGAVQKTLLRGFSCCDGSKQFGVITPVLTIICFL